MGAKELGYTQEEIDAAAQGADLGLGCGNPQAIASLKPGEVVVDLGSGAGMIPQPESLWWCVVHPAVWCCRLRRHVGCTCCWTHRSCHRRRYDPGNGREGVRDRRCDRMTSCGVSSTRCVLAQATENMKKRGLSHVDIRQGFIEALPVDANSADVIISNCVINLSPDKAQVFREAFRVLKSGGRVAVSDVVRTADMPADVLHDLAAHCGCIAGAASVEELRDVMAAAGFVDIDITPMDTSKKFIDTWLPGKNPGDYVLSASIKARKP